ncbi:MAG TPA: HEAT repeat domain-containing protein [Gemmatimonadaceae bacterium]|nr:HEAT repeat domain-containing protein [Gemmatimonadaceae bacterium]
MDFSVLFGRFFARLTWLIRSQPESVDEQKGALRALVMAAKDGAITLRAEGGRLTANGTPLPEILTGVEPVAKALSGAVSYALHIDKGAAPADILGVARVVATESPDPLVQRITQLAPKNIRIESVGEAAAPARARETAQLTTEMIAEIEADKARTAAAEAAEIAAAESAAAEAAAAQAAAAEQAAAKVDDTPAVAAPAAAAEPEPAPPAPEPDVRTTGDDTLDALFERLAAVMDPKSASSVLEELAGRIDVHARQGNVPMVLRGVAVMIEREQSITDADIRRAYLVSVRRVFRAPVLRLIMPALQREDQREMVRLVLRHAGDDGARVVFDELQRARTIGERRDLLALMRELPATVPAAIKLLEDQRWYVVRAAIEVLGELGGDGAERALADTLKHADERVRRAATAALARFESVFAVDALYRALADPSAQIRLQAVYGLSMRKGNAKAALVVVSAIDEEPEIEVQLAEIAALGRFATSEAVQKLARAAEPDGRLFGRKNSAYRIAAVRALADARTPAAMATLQTLTGDREKDVRDAASRAMGR